MARRFTILVVEDDSAVRDLVVRMLSERGFGVVAASDGYEALRILAENRPIDVLFADIVMAGIDGVQLAKQAKLMRPEIKVLFATGYVQKANERGAVRVGRVLYKPLREVEVVGAVQAVLAA
ncbi:MAG TPA: response regulator [Stellaceae bacterium]|nr:response regulator [Stellaceae bacterium]